MEPHRPTMAVPGNGWWGDYDQTHYIRSTLGFAQGDLSPAAHWYLPLYPLAAVPFLHVVPGDPYLPVNLLCFLLSAWLSGAIGRSLAPRLPAAGNVALALFIAAELIPPSLRAVWVVPWTTSLATPLMLGCLAGALRLDVSRRLFFNGAFCGLTGALVGGCRPVDGALLLALVAAFGTVSFLGAPRRRPVEAAKWLAGGAVGATVGALPTVVAYLLIWGPHMSPYLASSAQIGFEPRLLILHWVEIMISPWPLLPDGEGMFARLPFMVTGMAALLVAALLARRGPDALAALLVFAFTLLYLAYRDLHAPGIWAYHNIHYFKWSMGILALYTVRVLQDMWARPQLGGLLVIVMVGMTFWRVQAVPQGDVGPAATGGHVTFTLPPTGTMDGVAVAGTGMPDRIYFGAHAITLNGAIVAPIADFKAFPIAGGMLIQPLRPWRAGAVDLTVAPGIALTGRPEAVRLRVRPGLPCWSPDWSRACRDDFLFSAPVLDAGVPVTLGAGKGQEISVQGWCPPDMDGRWTCGPFAELRFAVALPGGVSESRQSFTLSASALVPPGSAPLRTSLWADDRKILTMVWRQGDTRKVTFLLPAAAVKGGRSVTLELRVDNPRSPHAVFANSPDMRSLGLFVRDLVWSGPA